MNTIYLIATFLSIAACSSIPPKHFIKYFIDSTLEVEDWEGVDTEDIVHTVLSMPIEDFCFRMATLYYSRCFDLNPEKAVPIYHSCSIELQTDTNFDHLLDRMPLHDLFYFSILPPGSLRDAMYRRLGAIKHYEFFPILHAKACEHVPYPNELWKDIFLLYNEFIENADFDVLTTHITSLRSSFVTNIVRLIKPSNYAKIGQIHKSKHWAKKAFNDPYSGTEEHFTIGAANKFGPEMTGSTIMIGFIWRLVTSRPLILIESSEKMNGERAISFLKGLKQLIMSGNSKSPHPNDPIAKRYIRSALNYLESGIERLPFQHLLTVSNDTDPIDGIELLEPSVFDGLLTEISTKIRRMAKVPNSLNTSHQQCIFSNGPANPTNFLNILTSRNPTYFFSVLRARSRCLTDGQIKMAKQIAKIAFGDKYSLYELQERRMYLAGTQFTYSVIHQTQRFLLHSLLFEIGAFGSGLNKSVKRAYRALAKLFFPDEVAFLIAVIELHGMRPPIETLLALTYPIGFHPNICKTWLIEFYGTIDEDITNPRSLKRLLKNAEAFEEALKWTDKIYFGNNKLPTRWLNKKARIASLHRLCKEAGEHKIADKLIKTSLLDPYYKTILTVDVESRDSRLMEQAEAIFGSLTEFDPLLIPMFVYLWLKRCGEDYTFTTSHSASLQMVHSFITKLVRNDFAEVERGKMTEKHWKLIVMLSGSSYVRLSDLLKGLELSLADFIAIIPDTLVQRNRLDGINDSESVIMGSIWIVNFITKHDIDPRVALRFEMCNRRLEECFKYYLKASNDIDFTYQTIKEYFDRLRSSIPEDDRNASSKQLQIKSLLPHLDQCKQDIPKWAGIHVALSEKAKNLSRIILVYNKSGGVIVSKRLLLVHPYLTGMELYALVRDLFKTDSTTDFKLTCNTRAIVADDTEIDPTCDLVTYQE